MQRELLAGEQDTGFWGMALSTTAEHAPVPKAEEGLSVQVCASGQSHFSIFSNPSHSCVVLVRNLVGLSAWCGSVLPAVNCLFTSFSVFPGPSQILRSIPWVCSLRVARCRTHPPRGEGSGLWLGGRTLSANEGSKLPLFIALLHLGPGIWGPGTESDATCFSYPQAPPPLF